MLLKDKVCIVTGGASFRGLGRAAAGKMAEQGAQIVILDLDHEAANAAARDVARSGYGLACDVTDLDACRRAVETVLEYSGRIDVLVNNAGISQPLKLMEIKADDYDAVLDVSLRGTLNMSQAVTPTMRSWRSGSIVCLSSISAQRGGGIFGGPHYSAAKAGVLGLAKAMARELGPDGIRVNCIAPSLIQTDIAEGKITDEMKAKILEQIPLGRLGEADDVAGVVLFLASDLSSYVTGAVIDVNGGMLIHG
ncbi:MAG: SDR family NAD(P)-dependent oxidoreductase [Geminicoccaceae bacterium]